MAKKNISMKFSKASLSKDDGKYIVTEVSKDDISCYNLTELLDGLVGTDGLSISITSEDEIEPISED